MLCHVSKPHETSMVCGQPDLSALFDVINLTGYTGLILQALVLPHLGRVLKTLPFALAPSDAVGARAVAGVYWSYCACLQPDHRVLGCRIPIKSRKSRRTDGRMEAMP